MNADTPAETLRAAAQELRSPTIPGLTPHIALMHPAFGEALAEWLDAEVKRWDAAVVAAERVWPSSLDDADDAEARTTWLDGRISQQALAVARALLGGAE